MTGDVVAAVLLDPGSKEATPAVEQRAAEARLEEQCSETGADVVVADLRQA